MFKIATWNVNSLRVRLGHVIDWLNVHSPDVLALQETKLTDDNFPIDEIKLAGYEARFIGQKTYNGVAILSKDEAEVLGTAIPDYEDVQRRILAVKTRDICVLDLYVPNGSEIGSEKYDYKLEWFSHLHRYIQDLKHTNQHLIMLGDFNIAPEDRDVHDPKEWEGKVLVSPKEREEFFQLLRHGFEDCFRVFEQEENSFSWWDYRAAGFRRNRGLRIDHILASKELAKSCKACYIDKAPRKLERPSDHTPVVAEFDFVCT